MDANIEFHNAIISHGWNPGSIYSDGEIHRFDIDRRRDKAGWYWFIGKAGAYGSWKGEKYDWTLNGETWDVAKKTEFKAKMQAVEKDRATAKQKAKKRAEFIWQKATEADQKHPYLLTKGVKPHGILQYKGALVVPARNADGAIESIQFISGTGDKRFLKDGHIQGNYFEIPGTDQRILCEGYATGASIHEATDATGIIAFNAGNLKSVAEKIRAKYPGRSLVICADNDQWTTKPDGTPWNPGKEKALSIGWKFNLKVAIPDFPDVENRPTDFNDLHQLEGIQVVRKQVEAAKHPQDILFNEVETDPGAPFRSEHLEALKALKARDQAGFESLRAKLKRSKTGVTRLDEAIQKNDVASKGKKGGASKPTQADMIIDVARMVDVEFFHSPESDVYARFPVGEHFEIYPVRVRQFRRYLARQVYKREGKVPSSQAINDALTVLEGIGQYEGPEHRIFLRVGDLDGRIYVDLANDKWEAVEISKQGYRVIQKPPVYFRRPYGMLPLPVPFQKGNIEDLKPFLNLPKSTEDFTWVLTVAWLVQTFRPVGPYPPLSIIGEQGSAKSTFERLLKGLVDPNISPLRTAPRDERDFAVSAKNSWVLGYDNLSGLHNWLSDAFCRASTGGGLATRQLYTDDEEILLDFQRPMILNGIDGIIYRHDLADRAIFVDLEPIPESKRKLESEIFKAFEQARPSILGGLFYAVSTALENIDETSLDKLPRMADFALWVQAAESALPWAKGEFLKAYSENRTQAIEHALDSDLVGSAVRKLIEKRGFWRGTAGDLLDELEREQSEKTLNKKGWPKSPSSISNRLRRSASFLRSVGIEVSFLRDKNVRSIKIERVKSMTANDGVMTADDGDERKERHQKSLFNQEVSQKDDGDDGDDGEFPYIKSRIEKQKEDKEEGKEGESIFSEVNRKGTQNAVRSVIAVIDSPEDQDYEEVVL